MGLSANKFFNTGKQGIDERRVIREGIDRILIKPLEDVKEDEDLKPVLERGYYDLGNFNNIQTSVSSEVSKIGYDTTPSSLEIATDSLELTAEMGYKNFKLLAKLGFWGVYEEKIIPVGEIKEIKTYTIPKDLAVETIEITLSGELENGLFSFNKENGETIKLIKAESKEKLSVNSYFFNKANNKLTIKGESAETLKSWNKIKVLYQDAVLKESVHFGGSNQLKKQMSIILSYSNDEGKYTYMKIHKASMSIDANVLPYISQQSGSNSEVQTISVKFTADQDISKPNGKRLFELIDDFDLSSSVKPLEV